MSRLPDDLVLPHRGHTPLPSQCEGTRRPLTTHRAAEEPHLAAEVCRCVSFCLFGGVSAANAALLYPRPSTVTMALTQKEVSTLVLASEPRGDQQGLREPHAIAALVWEGERAHGEAAQGKRVVVQWVRWCSQCAGGAARSTLSDRGGTLQGGAPNDGTAVARMALRPTLSRVGAAPRIGARRGAPSARARDSSQGRRRESDARGLAGDALGVAVVGVWFAGAPHQARMGTDAGVARGRVDPKKKGVACGGGRHALARSGACGAAVIITFGGGSVVWGCLELARLIFGWLPGIGGAESRRGLLRSRAFQADGRVSHLRVIRGAWDDASSLDPVSGGGCGRISPSHVRG